MKTQEQEFEFAKLQEFCDALGWTGLVRHEHTLRDSADLAASVVHWYESGSADDLLLQINVRPCFCACVFAMRYRICSGWYAFELSGESAAVAEACRLRDFIAREQFDSPKSRNAFRTAHAECAHYSQKRLRQEGPPFDIGQKEVPLKAGENEKGTTDSSGRRLAPGSTSGTGN